MHMLYIFLYVSINLIYFLHLQIAGHELKGSIAYFNALSEFQRTIVRVPMLALVDYMGFRLIAISLLPIQADKTLIYGTRDAGITVKNSDRRFYDAMMSCAKKVRYLYIYIYIYI